MQSEQDKLYQEEIIKARNNAVKIMSNIIYGVDMGTKKK